MRTLNIDFGGTFDKMMIRGVNCSVKIGNADDILKESIAHAGAGLTGSTNGRNTSLLIMPEGQVDDKESQILKLLPTDRKLLQNMFVVTSSNIEHVVKRLFELSDHRKAPSTFTVHSVDCFVKEFPSEVFGMLGFVARKAADCSQIDGERSRLLITLRMDEYEKHRDCWDLFFLRTLGVKAELI